MVTLLKAVPSYR